MSVHESIKVSAYEKVSKKRMRMKNAIRQTTTVGRGSMK